MRRLLPLMIALLVFAALGLALRHDLAQRAARQGAALLADGDWASARAALGRAIALGFDSAELRYDLGVSHYSSGEFELARQAFGAALAGAPPELAVAAAFNRGNSAFRLAEAAADPQTAATHWREAVADYDEALHRDAAANDAVDNRALAGQRLAANNKGRDKPSRRADAGRPADASTAVNAAAAGAAGSSSTAEAGGGAAAGRPQPPGTGRLRQDLTRSEAERLLNEARGRATLAGSLHAGLGNGPTAPPDQDW